MKTIIIKTKIIAITSIIIAVLSGFPSLGDLFSSEKNTWKIENIQLNNNTVNAIEIAPGKEINISLDIKIWNTKQCNNCSKQIVLMLNDQKLHCIYDANSGIEKPDYITIQQKIMSPYEAGEYILYAVLFQEESCETAIMHSNNSIDKEQLAVIRVNGKIDDWVLNYRLNGSPQNNKFNRMAQSYKRSSPAQLSMHSNLAYKAAAKKTIGFSVGGAKDIQNFRENIHNDFLPLPTDITHEGLFYDYYFETNKKEECDELFCPSYDLMTSHDPLSAKLDYFMSVGLNSNLSEADFERKPLNLVIVLDISGSMGSSFNHYYYDGVNGKQNTRSNQKASRKSKMEVASNSVVSLLKHLKPSDRFGLVLFNSNALLAKPLSLVGQTDMSAISDHILEIQHNGGTNMSSGMIEGTKQFDDLEQLNSAGYENRIIFLTDAMPNLGRTNEGDLINIAEKNATRGIHSTFIGIGVDFNTQLVEHITKIRGANYYSVHNDKEFERRMDEEFEFMVTPLVFNLQLTLDSKGFEIEKVYGSPEADEASGDIMKINTLFPSATNDEKTRGGLVLLKLRKIGEDATITLRASYENRKGEFSANEKVIIFNEQMKTFSNGIRKGVLLTRYANLLQNWMQDERQYLQKSKWIFPSIDDIKHRGCLPPNDKILLGKWERKSQPLTVSKNYKTALKYFMEYFKEEMNQLGDEGLARELEILHKITHLNS